MTLGTSIHISITGSITTWGELDPSPISQCRLAARCASHLWKNTSVHIENKGVTLRLYPQIPIPLLMEYTIIHPSV